MTNGFELVSDQGDQWLERRIIVDGHAISVQLRPEAKFFQASLPHAEALINDIEHIILSIQKFVSDEKRKFAAYLEDLDHLNVVTIAFVSTTEPDVAEITFDENLTGRIWGCAYKNGQFFNLGFDD